MEAGNELSYSKFMDHELAALATFSSNIGGEIKALGKKCIINSAAGPLPLVYQLCELGTDEPEFYPNLPEQFHKFLSDAEGVTELTNYDAIGLQWYPGLHIDWSFFGVDAVMDAGAKLPSDILAQLDLFADFGKPIHITELAMPSAHCGDWANGYWIVDFAKCAEENWTEELQADYVERLWRLIFSHPAAESITWWDLIDGRGFSAATLGCLFNAEGKPKLVAERMRSLISEWTSHFVEDSENGVLSLRGFAGSYSYTAVTGSGRQKVGSFTIVEGETSEIEVVI